MAHASRLDEWRPAGRRGQFAATLLQTPPKGKYKERYLRVKPLGIDWVVDMNGVASPSAADVDNWLGPQPATAAAIQRGE